MLINTELYDGIENVEFIISSTVKTKYFFPELPKLNGKLIRRIEFNYSGNTPYTPSAISGIALTPLTNMFLNLLNGETEQVQQYPARDLYILTDFQNRNEIFNFIVNWGKSYIELSSLTSISANTAFTVTIYYQDYNKKRFFKSLPKLKIDYLEAIVTSTTDYIIKLTNFRNLNNKKLYRINAFNPAGSTYYTPDGRVIIPIGQMLSSYLTLWDSEEEIIKDFPMVKMINDMPIQSQVFLRGLKIDWDKSFIKLGSLSGLTVGQTYYLPVFYTD